MANWDKGGQKNALREGEKSMCEYDNAIREDESTHSVNVGKGQEHTLEERKGVCV